MEKAKQLQTIIKESYLVAVLGILGVVAAVSAVLISWPALAYLGAKLFN